MNIHLSGRGKLSRLAITASAMLLASTAGVATATTPATTPSTDGAATAGTSGPIVPDPALFDLLPDAVKDSKVLRFGALWETPPVIGVDPSDTTKPVGFAPDMAAAIGEVLGVNIEWQNMQWPAQLPGVQSGVVDALFGQVTITAEREQSIVDLIPFYKQNESLIIGSDNPHQLTKLGDACGLTIGIPVGSVQGETVTRVSESACTSQGKPAIIAAEYQGATAAISAVRAGTVDGWLDSTSSQLAAAAASEGALITVSLPEDEDPPAFTGIAVGKDQPGVSKAILGAFEQLMASGKYLEIMRNNGLEWAAVSPDELKINPITGTPAGEQATPATTAGTTA